MLDTQYIQCPYCWEVIEIVIDPSEPQQDYIEDCFVCCRPIHLQVSITHTGEPVVQARSEDE
ncbi:CPXCG motif-containing cysteine-rich protein [Thiomicrospira sp. R3]|uniref:CPXCG motif-containing cysteine-rich protein n=1 Tax=Thiomicrospira sp. R3 TaxID=3035472 RepID=UPI00259B18B0|nr:CPXCG motif-containing cysteine-rich protein [Thiomicrospira sp. R3]WFE69593.1 CPXCG motif-containing cysteine-rich protein [Thiomicrospira sp. R3]